MLRKKGKNSITRSALYSIGLHLSLLLFTIISMIFPKKENNLLVDVEIAGEGEFREAMESVHHSSFSSDIPLIEEEAKKESKVIEEKNIPEMTEEPQTVQELHQEQQEKIEEQQEPEPKEKPEEKIENKINEHSVPEEKKNQKERVEKKKEPKRNKKTLMNIINKAEKAKKKRERIRKIRDLADKEARRKNDSDFEKMLDKSSNDRDGGKQNGSGYGQKGMGAGAFGVGNGITESDYEMISSQIYPYWVVPSGVRDAENIIIEIHIELGDNGEVIPSSIKIVDEKRYASDYVFRAAADSARRAVLQASPLSIPKEKMNLFREITLRFNLKEALGE